MRIIALDLATKTGVAVGDTTAAPFCFTEVLGSSGDRHGPRFLQAFVMTRRMIKKYEPDLIALEAPITPRGNQRRKIPEVLMGIRACVMAAAEYDGIKIVQFEVNVIRKHFIGHGGLKRDAAKAAVIKQCGLLGWTVASDDEADAAALWDYACATNSRSHGLAQTPLFGQT